MGRPTRFRLAGIPQLITQRGHNRLPCFIDGEDYSLFRDILTESAELADCEVQALLMLPSAYWILALPAEPDSVARMIQRTGRCYVRHCNEKYRREGTLWAGRYRACLVEPKKVPLSHCLAYIENTPARNGVVAAGTQWPWMFVDGGLKGGKATGHQAEFDAISSSLEKGLVYGSEVFRREIAEVAGVRTEPGLRGRPSNTVNA